MNIGSSLNSTYCDRPYLRPIQAQRKSDTALSYDKSERRMEHSSFQPNNLLMSFWDVVQRLPRQEQLSLATNVIATQITQNGINRENRDFLRSLKNRFNQQEISTIVDSVKQHPLLQKKGAKFQEEFLRTVQEILEMPTSARADEHQQPLNLLNQPQPRSPEELFFQMTLNQREKDKKTPVEAFYKAAN